jgi:hypothetical protein
VALVVLAMPVSPAIVAEAPAGAQVRKLGNKIKTERLAGAWLAFDFEVGRGLMGETHRGHGTSYLVMLQRLV